MYKMEQTLVFYYRLVKQRTHGSLPHLFTNSPLKTLTATRSHLTNIGEWQSICLDFVISLSQSIWSTIWLLVLVEVLQSSCGMERLLGKVQEKTYSSIASQFVLNNTYCFISQNNAKNSVVVMVLTWVILMWTGMLCVYTSYLHIWLIYDLIFYF